MGRFKLYYLLATNSSQRCLVCDISPKDINNLDILNKEYTHREFKSCILHIKKTTGKWQARSKEDKEKVSVTKKKI